MARVFRNILGSFSDGAILFPLIAAIASGTGVSSAQLFLSTSLLYFVSGFWFRVPMAVQPLKAIAIAAIVSGASFLEIRWAGALLGVLCLACLMLPVEKMKDRIPKYVIQGIQLSLGLMLMRRGVEILSPVLPNLWTTPNVLLGMGCVVSLILGRAVNLSFLGVLAALGVVLGLSHTGEVHAASQVVDSKISLERILVLVAPQLLLTGTNSVISTCDVAHRYFGDQAKRVTIRSLLTSIGLGNCLVALMGGLPFCHGSGGVTAHVRGGSDHWLSNFVIGLFLLGLSLFQFYGANVSLQYPPFLLGLMLLIVGGYHALLAKPSWKEVPLRPFLIVMGIVSVLTNNLLLGLTLGLALQLGMTRFVVHRSVYDSV